MATISAIHHSSAKLTVSIKRRLGNGDEVFLAPGIEISCAPEDLDETQIAVTARVNAWVETLLEAYPDPTDDAEEGDEDEAEDEDETEDEAEDEDEDEDEDEEGLSEEDIDAMDKKALVALIKEQELEADPKLAIKALRAAVKEELFSEEDEDETEDEDEDGDGDDEARYTDEELKAMKLEELQEICKTWSIGDPKLKKGVDVKAKKLAYVKHILAAQADAEE